MQYHTQLPPLQLREYGRSVQDMVAAMKAEPDRDRRSAMARQIVRVMKVVAPANEERQDYERSLWDHLFALSGYDLDIDAPYPLVAKPQVKLTRHVPYYRLQSRQRQYGANIDLLIAKALALPEGPEQQAFFLEIARIMKMLLQTREGIQPTDVQVLRHLEQISEGRIRLKLQEGQEIVVGKLQQAISNKSLNEHARKKVKKKPLPMGRSGGWGAAPAAPQPQGQGHPPQGAPFAGKRRKKKRKFRPGPPMG